MEAFGQFGPRETPLEFISGEVVHHRVQAGVKAGQTQGDGMGALDGVLKRAAHLLIQFG